MTTAQPMLRRRRGAPHGAPARHPLSCALAALFLAGALLTPACTSSHPDMPEALRSPYPSGTEVIWAVVPLRNESGVSFVDDLALSDTLVNELSQTQGVSVLPVNRTVAAMRALNVPQVATPQEALALAKALGVDAVIVGTITAYDPYDPPTLGLNLALIGESPAMGARLSRQDLVDPIALQWASIDRDHDPAAPDAPGAAAARPFAAVAELFDAANGSTRQSVRRYAFGRHDPKAPLGWKRYVASMALYAKFACYEASRRLLAVEQARLGGARARGDGTPAR